MLYRVQREKDESKNHVFGSITVDSWLLRAAVVKLILSPARKQKITYVTVHYIMHCQFFTVRGMANG
jgi:hypothetical protein